MPNLLKLKRGAAASIPQGALAEPLFTSDTYDLYIGKGAGGNQRFQKYITSGTSSQFLKGDGSLDSTSYQPTITLTTTGSSGASTFVSNTLNVPNYTLSGLGGEPAITPGTTSQYWRGDKSWQTLDTNVVPENGPIYFTEPRVLATVLTGLNLSGGGTIAATDSILTAFGKVQNQISALVGGATYQGIWNASTNSPTLTSGTGTKGFYYVVSVAGSTNLDGITDWKVGDWAIFNGTTWDKVDNTDAVSSVNGFTGAVNLGLGDISNVTLTSPTNAQLLRFNGTSSKWENWTPTYISGNQTITLSGDVSGSGATAITTTIGALKVTNSMLAGTIDYAKMDATTVPTWNQNTTGSAATLTTARTLTIGATGKTFNGSANVSWSLAEIGAAAALSGTINTITYWDSASTIASLSTATYPTLTELSYVKGVTSGIQTQLNAKEPTVTKGNLTESTSSVLTITGGTGAVIGSGTTIEVKSASATQNGVITTGTQTIAGVKTFSSAVTSTNFVLSGGTGNTGLYYGHTDRVVLANYTAGGIDFETNGGTIYMTLFPSGNLAVKASATDAGYKLDVDGTGRFSGALSGTSATFSDNITITIASGTKSIGFGGNTIAAAANALIYSDTNYLVLNSKAGSRLYLNYDNTNASSLVDFFAGKATINKDGAATFSSSVGIGSTPSSWGGNFITSEYKGGFVASQNTSYLYLGQNAYFDGTNWVYKNTAAASMLEQVAGAYNFYTAASGTAGGTITWSPKFTIANTGAATFSAASAANTVTINGASGYFATRINGNSTTGSSYGLGIFAGTNSSDDAFRVHNYSGTEYFRVRGDGNVGIGTTSPSNILSIAASTNSGSGSTYPLTSISNTLATQGDGSTTFNFAGLLVQSGNGAVQFYHSTSYATGTWEPQALLNVATNHPLIIRTNNAERMRITSGGNVGIGTASPTDFGSTYKTLQVTSTADDAFFLATNATVTSQFRTSGSTGMVGTRSNHDFTFSTNNVERMRIKSDGEVLIGTTTDAGAYLLQVNGSVYATAYYESSDIRLKDVLTNSYSENFSAIEFMWKDKRDEKKHWGYAAQDVMKYIPDAIEVNNDGMMTVNYNEAHTWKIAQLEAKILELEAKLK